MKKFAEEFKTFITRGNVIDMAVGVIVGGAFTAIVNSLVGDLFTPLINLLTGQLNFTDWVLPIATSQLMIGNFVQAVLNFLLTAFCLFLLLRGINRLRELDEKRKAAKEAEEAVAEEPAEPEPTKEELLLTEIRDLLKSKAE